MWLTPACQPAPEPTPATAASPATTVAPSPTHTQTPSSTSSAPVVAPASTPQPLLDRKAQAAALLPAHAGDLEKLDHLTEYEIDVTVWPEKSQLAGHMHVLYTNTESASLDLLPFRLFPNLPGQGGRLTVQSISLNGYPVASEYALEDTALLLALNPPLQAGQSVSVSMDFIADIPSTTEVGPQSFINQHEIIALAGFHPIIPAYGNQGWNLDVPPAYGDPLFAEIALFRIRLTVPRPMVVASTGVMVDETIDATDQTRTLTLISGPARECNLVMSAHFQAASDMAGETRVRSYFPPEDRTAGLQALHTAVECIEIFTELFGPYPYTELDVVQSASRLGGIEYPGLIVVSDVLYAGEAAGSLDWIVAHETAHQWWYGMVGNDQVHEPWLDEALTNYSAWLYFERTMDEESAQEVYAAMFTEPAEITVQQGYELPIGLPVAAYDSEAYYPIVYSKGAQFWHALRLALGDDVFLDILQGYYARYAYDVATGPDFLATANAISGQDISPLYNEWVHGK